MRAKAAMVFLILMTVWAGIIIGVSMIATPDQISSAFADHADGGGDWTIYISLPGAD